MVDIIDEEPKRRIPSNVDPSTGKRMEPPVVPTGLNVPQNVMDFFIGLGINQYYHFEDVIWRVRGRPRFIKLENRSLEPFNRALIETVSAGLGSELKTPVSATKVWFDPEVFGVLGNPIGNLTRDFLDTRRRFRAMCMGLLSPYLKEEGEFNINLKHPNVLERINRYSIRALGQPLGDYYFRNDNKTGVIKIDDLHQRIIPELLTYPEVNTLPFIGDLLKLPERIRHDRLVGPDGKLTPAGVTAFEANPNAFLGVPFVLREMSTRPTARNGHPMIKFQPSWEDEEFNLLKLHHTFTQEPELPD